MPIYIILKSTKLVLSRRVFDALVQVSNGGFDVVNVKWVEQIPEFIVVFLHFLLSFSDVNQWRRNNSRKIQDQTQFLVTVNRTKYTARTTSTIYANSESIRDVQSYLQDYVQVAVVSNDEHWEFQVVIVYVELSRFTVPAKMTTASH